MTSNSSAIEKVAKDFKIEPDIIRALIWTESTHGWADRIIPDPKSIRPMNINVDVWKGLVPDIGKVYFDKEFNIRTGALIYKRLEERVTNPSIEKIASLYNNTSTDEITPYGKAVYIYYLTKPWLK